MAIAPTKSSAIRPMASPASDLSTLSGDEALASTSGPSSTLKASTAKANTSHANGVDQQEGEKGTYCHHCHKKVDPTVVSRCSNVRQIGKQSKTCGRVYCHRDLTKRYGYPEGQVPGSEAWRCPCCDGVCMESGCRKKRDSLSTDHPFTSSSTPSKPPTQHNPTSIPPTRATPLTNAKSEKDPFTALTPSQKHNKVSSLAKSDKSLKRDSSGFELDAPIVITDGEESDLTDLEDQDGAKAKGGTGPHVKAKKEAKAKKGPKAEKGGETGEPKAKKARLSVVIPDKRSKNKGNSEEKQGGSKAGGKDGKEGKAKKPRASTASTAAKDKEKSGKGKMVAKGKGEGKEKKTPTKATSKAKAKGAAKTPTKATPKPKPKAPPVPRPKFEQVATVLSKGDVEYRIQLREYLYRFHEVLSIPPRLLPAVDDFDRPLTEASVKLFAGAMLDVFKDEFPDDDDEEEVVELHNKLFKFREELRFYGDLARFVQIYNALVDDLELVLPPPAPSSSSTANTTDLGTKRNASRLPSTDEVIRMLVSMAERTLESPLIHDDLDASTGEAQAQREHARDVKAENTRWEGEKKKLVVGQLKAKSAAEGKKIAEQIKAGSKEHQLRISTLDVNLRANLARRSVRYTGPLGTDTEGRQYYLLTPRVVEEYGRPPVGWASGLVCWGRGGGPDPTPAAGSSAVIKATTLALTPGKGKATEKNDGKDNVGANGTAREEEEEEEEELPVEVERWSHFGTSEHIAQLAKWLAANKCDAELVKRVQEAREWVEVLEYKGQGEM